MMWNKLNALRRVCRVSILRTLFLNFYMLPFSQAIRMPIILSRNVRFYDLSGKIIINNKIKFGMIRFGFLGEDNLYWNSEKTLLNIQGTLNISAKVRFANGVLIRVDKNAVLSLSKNVSIGNKTKIICSESISIGEDTSITWECQIIDTNFHYIVNVNDKSYGNVTSPISIGKNVFVGYRSTISKGIVLKDYTIVCSHSLVNKNLVSDQYTMLAGIPAKIIKKGYYRAMYKEEKEIKQKVSKL